MPKSKQIKFACECGVSHILFVDNGKMKHTVIKLKKEKKNEDEEKDNSNTSGYTVKDFILGSGAFAADLETEDTEETDSDSDEES